MRIVLAFLLFQLTNVYGAEPARLPTYSSYTGDVRQMLGSKIIEVEFIGADVSDPIRERFEALKGRELRPSLVKQAIQWFHENGGDSLLEVFAEELRGGVRLYVKVQEKVKIETIVFRGNSVATENALRALIDLKEESEYDSEQVNGAVAKISNFYSTQGYLGSEVKSDFDSRNRTLTFTISEGEPTLVGSFSFSPLDNIEDKALRARYERDIGEAFGLVTGDRIQRDSVLEGIQRVKEWLREHDYLTAKDPVLEYKVNEEGRVNLHLNIEYGPRIRFGFRGNRLYSYRELLAFVSEVKEVSSGSDYLSAIRRRILEAYRDIGYGNAVISTIVREDPAKGIRQISLVIDEGEKVAIQNLEINGVFSMSEDEAKKKFYSLATRLVQRNFFHEAGITRAAELFAEHLISRGYLSAKLEFSKFDFNEDKTKVNVSLLFSEGVQTVVDEIKLNGVNSFSEEETLRILSLERGKPFDIFAFERGLVALKDRYQDMGNLSAQILNEGSESIVRYSRDNSQVSIQLDVDEGPIFRVGEILVRGNQQTHARVILRELPFISKDVLTRPLLNEAEDNLRKLNLFASVIVRPIDRPGEESVKDILILIEETEPGVFEVAPGYRNDLGLRLALGVGYQNLGGWHRSVSAQAVFNRRTENYRFPEYNISLGFREPYLANWPVVFTTNLNLLRRQFTSFDATVSRVTTAVKRDLTKTLSGFLEYGYERVEVQNARGRYTPDDERTDFIGSITPGLILDSRNDRFNPSEGFYSINRFEFASRLFGSEEEIGYIRTISNNSYYLRILEDIVLAFAVNVGFERSNVAGKEIPIFKLFRLGGVGSIRGYAEDDIEVETTRDIKGILASLNYRSELRVPISGSLGTALFLDAGNLMVDRISFNPSELRSSAGAGLRYVTPVGPVLLDFAWRLQSSETVGDTQLRNADRFKIHFAIGAF